MARKELLLFLMLAVICIGLAFGVGYFAHAYLAPSGDPFPLLSQAHNILQVHGLNEIPSPPSLEYGMIRGMLQSYGDPNTIFVEPIQHELDSDNLHGSFGGIGVRLARNEAGQIILYPFQDSPAAMAGILDGDHLRQVNETVIQIETAMEDVIASVRGPVGERVTLIISRPPSMDSLEYSIRRESVPLPSVTWHINTDYPQVGMIEINILAASTPDEIEKAVADLQAQGAQYYILDLRDNNGGLLNAGIETARLFLSSGPIIQQQYRGQKAETYRVNQPGPLHDLPLVVLINHNTASSAEIVAGALQQANRAVLVGQPSFGKDSIQLVFDLDDGSSLHVTAARWWFPELDPPIRDHGLVPDEAIPDGDPVKDLGISTAIDLLLNSGAD